MKKFVVLGMLLSLLSGFSVSATSFDVYLTRHYEKQASKDNPALTPAGLKRAAELAKHFSDKELSVVYSTNYRRTLQTATPVADKLGLEVTLYNPSEMEAFVTSVKKAQKSVLIVGHSNTTPTAIEMLGGKAKFIAETDFGELFKVTVSEGAVSTSSQIIGID